MKAIPHFDQHNHDWLRAVLKDDTPVTTLSKERSLALYEVWLVGQGVEAITPEFLAKASFNSVEQLLAHYQVSRSRAPRHAAGKEIELVREFGEESHLLGAEFHYSIVHTNAGPVISVVCGSREAMEVMFDAGLRDRHGHELEDECSD